jgi:PKD repeat protein
MKRILLFTGIFLFSFRAFPQLNSLCTRANAKTDLDIGNVRAALLNSGDLWWDLQDGQYEVPKGSGKRSVFSGALWFGGIDETGQLHTACMTYRQTGSDFWPGPLDTVSASTFDSVCWRYDRFWKINRSQVESFLLHHNDTGYVIPEAILSWPGNGNAANREAHFLAPFTDVDGDGFYNPMTGDYPAFAPDGSPDCDYNLPGDQAVWWVFNDAGNLHTETNAPAFGMEVQATAFAFNTNDHLKNATFYRYKIINRSSGSWNDFWMGQFVDSDLGDYQDDYVGCDVTRGLAYTYNGDADDGPGPIAMAGTYGSQPPAVGVDFIQGPLADEFDLIDNDRDSSIDEPGERIKMSVFKYYSGDFSVQGNPETSLEFYNYLAGKWKDGSWMTYGGNAYGGTAPCPFMFPGDSDPYGWGTNGAPQAPWSEASSNNTPGDRRFVTSVGPFTMSPGEVQTVTIAAPWARDSSASGNNLTAILKLREADDYIQLLFESCFTLPCSSDPAPSFSFTVNAGRVDFLTEAGDGTYNWDFGDGATSSVKHPVHYFIGSGTYHVCLTVTNSCGTQTVCNDIEIELPEEECGPAIQRLEGKGSGPFVLDMADSSVAEIFSSPDGISHYPWYKPMHAPVKVTYENYSALANGEYRIAFDSVSDSAHWKMWLIGGSDTVYSDSSIGAGEKQLIPQWGLGVEIRQVVSPGYNNDPENNGFLSSSIIYSDPQKRWLSGVQDNDQFPASVNWIRSGDYSDANQGSCAGIFDDRAQNNMFLDPDEHYENILGRTWTPYRLTSFIPAPAQSGCYDAGVAYYDLNTMINNLLSNLPSVRIMITSDKSKWSRCVVFEMGNNIALTEGGQLPMKKRLTSSVDKSGRTVAQGGISDVNDPEAADFIDANGMGWFPGYVINLETGERLNIAFGENSALPLDNGRDMLWNPTSNLNAPLGGSVWGGMHTIYIFNHNSDQYFSSGALSGQRRSMPVYDHCYVMNKILTQGANADHTYIFRDAAWTNIPLLASGHQLFESDVMIDLNVARPYAKFNTSAVPDNNDYPLYGFRVDKMELGCNMYDGGVSVFPNPFAENCTILFDNRENRTYTFRLYDTRGRLVRVIGQIANDRVEIRSEGLDAGLYIFTLETFGEKPLTGKVMVK